ncbi:hypothetical protein ACAG65_12090 [Halodesulfovibrio aestuarii]|uniref:hypothetical protein n=1 Tax=Halodesulfovibrio aestuarii TaxID=126333 RepID=UPI0035208FF4
MKKNKTVTTEERLRKLFHEDGFLDVEPPDNFLENVMGNLPNKVPTTLSPFDRFSRGIRNCWSIFSNPITVNISPLQVTASFALIFCCISFLYDTPYRKQGRLVNAVQTTPVALQLKAVSFALPDPDRKFSSAVVIGSFNKWQSQGFEMSYNEEKEAWVLEHELPPGDYEYVFLVNGDAPLPDPRAAFYVHDSFGNKNALLQVGGVLHDL